jgi:hypothetical protein
LVSDLKTKSITFDGPYMPVEQNRRKLSMLISKISADKKKNQNNKIFG